MSMSLLPRRRRAEDETGVTTLQRAMNDLFEDFLPSPEAPAFGVPFVPAGWLPRVDVVESDKEIVITTELPGLDEKNVDVTLVGDTLTIKGEKKSESEEKGRTYHRSERCWGSFQRSFELPCDVDRKNLAAVFQKGVLKVTLPKSVATQRPVNKIEVKPG